MKELLESIIQTMNTISVRGEEDMDKVSGCIKALRSIIDVICSCNQEKEEIKENG